MPITFVSAPIDIPEILLPPADKPAEEYYNEQRSNPKFVRAVITLNEKIAAGGQLLTPENVAPETLTLLAAILEAAQEIANQELSDKDAERLMAEGYAIPINGAYTTIMSDSGITLLYGRVGPIREGLPSMAAARYIATNTRRLACKFTGAAAVLTPESLAHLERLAAHLPTM